jgi:hypothetical protein
LWLLTFLVYAYIIKIIIQIILKTDEESQSYTAKKIDVIWKITIAVVAVLASLLLPFEYVMMVLV